MLSFSPLGPLSQAKLKKCKYKNDIKPKILYPLEILPSIWTPLRDLGEIFNFSLEFSAMEYLVYKKFKNFPLEAATKTFNDKSFQNFILSALNHNK